MQKQRINKKQLESHFSQFGKKDSTNVALKDKFKKIHQEL